MAFVFLFFYFLLVDLVACVCAVLRRFSRVQL